MKRAGVLLALAGCLWARSGRAAPLVDAESRRHSIQLALDRWDVGKAAVDAAALLGDHGETPLNLITASRVAFFQADYGRARALAAQAAAASAPDSGVAQEFLAYLDERSATWQSFDEYPSDNFLLRLTPRDALLAPFALDTLERAASALAADLGSCPPERVVVEVYPTRRSFIAASTLTREEVEVSGTVAICHFNRIMILSPAVSARGYDWLDTLCHEYVHHALYRIGGDGVPVWLHEGVAKVLESRWRDALATRLDPRLSSLLAEAREAGTWIPFADMHPSVAKLPSGALVSLAFAQVAATVLMLTEQGGMDSVRQMVQHLGATGGDLQGALILATDGDLDALEARVRQHVRTADLYRIPGLALLRDGAHDPLALRFQDEGEAPPAEDTDVQSLADRKLRDFALLGDRLRGRKYHAAAIIEYDKALAVLGRSEPLLVNRKAHAMLSSGRFAEALVVLDELLADHPDLCTTLDNLVEVHVQLGRLAAAGGRAEEARRHADTALQHARASERINPFNPDTQVRLISLLQDRGRPDELELARERLTTLLELSR